MAEVKVWFGSLGKVEFDMFVLDVWLETLRQDYLTIVPPRDTSSTCLMLPLCYPCLTLVLPLCCPCLTLVLPPCGPSIAQDHDRRANPPLYRVRCGRRYQCCPVLHCRRDVVETAPGWSSRCPQQPAPAAACAGRWRGHPQLQPNIVAAARFLAVDNPEGVAAHAHLGNRT